MTNAVGMTHRTDESGILRIVFDRPGDKVNLLTRELLDELDLQITGPIRAVDRYAAVPLRAVSTLGGSKVAVDIVDVFVFGEDGLVGEMKAYWDPAGIVHVDKVCVIANGVVGAVKQIELTVPLVVRLEGTNVEQGREILENSGLKITPAQSMGDAAAAAVAAVKEG